MQLLAKAITIYSNKKTKFNNINHTGSSKSTYFWLANSQFYFSF